MRGLSKLFGFPKRISSETKSPLFPILAPRHNSSLLLPSRCKSSTARRRRRGPSPNKKTSAAVPSLLHKITEIVGAKIDSSPDSAVAREVQFEDLKSADFGIQGVRRNALENAGLGNGEESISETSLQGEDRRESLEEEDVSPTVHKITEMVRLDSAGIGMEEQLERSGFVIDPNIVEKVLKRCFKVGHLARRFFNWAKRQHGFYHTTETYNVMIYIAGEATDFDLVEELLRDMEEESCLKNIKTWTTLVMHYGKAMQIGKALKAFEDMRKSGREPDRRIFETIIHALCKSKKAEVAKEFYHEMVSRDLEVGSGLYKKLMSCLSGLGDIASVRLLGNDMMKSADESVVYSCMLRSFCASGRIDEACDLVIEMKKKNLTFVSDDLRILLKGLCLAGKIAEALEVVDDMKNQDVVLDSKDCGLIIYGHLRRGNVSKACQLLCDMKRLGFLPTITTYTQVIHHLFKSANYGGACELYTEMLANGIEPDIMINTAMLVGHVRNNNIPESWKAFEKIKMDGTMSVSEVCSLFVKELCKASKPNQAFKVLMGMLETDLSVNDNILRLVTSSLSKNSDMDKVRELEQMYMSAKLHGLETLPVDLLTDRLASHEEHKSSNDLLQQVTVSNPTPVGYSNDDLNEACRILSSPCDWSLMQEELEQSAIPFIPELVSVIMHRCRRHGHAALQFFAWVGKLEGYTHTTGTYNMAIKISGSATDFRHMRNLYLEMRRRRCFITPDTWTIMICQYGQAGLTEMALKKFKEMKTEGYQPNRSTYKFMIIFLCGKKGRKVGEAIKVFQEMIRAGYMPDKETVDIYLSCLCEARELSEARKSVELLCKNGFGEQTSHAILIKSLCRAGRLEEAVELADELKHLGCTVSQYIYGSLVHGLLRAGKLDEAIAKIEAMKNAGISQTVFVYTSLLVHYFKEKQIEKATETFERMKKDGLKPTVVTYSALIRGYVSMDMVSAAWEVFDKMRAEGPLPDFKTYSMFIDCLCKSGRSEEGLMLLHEMMANEIFPGSLNFKAVFYGLNREGKQDLARSVLRTKWSSSKKRKFLT